MRVRVCVCCSLWGWTFSTDKESIVNYVIMQVKILHYETETCTFSYLTKHLYYPHIITHLCWQNNCAVYIKASLLCLLSLSCILNQLNTHLTDEQIKPGLKSQLSDCVCTCVCPCTRALAWMPKHHWTSSCTFFIVNLQISVQHYSELCLVVAQQGINVTCVFVQVGQKPGSVIYKCRLITYTSIYRTVYLSNRNTNISEFKCTQILSHHWMYSSSAVMNDLSNRRSEGFHSPEPQSHTLSLSLGHSLTLSCALEGIMRGWNHKVWLILVDLLDCLIIQSNLQLRQNTSQVFSETAEDLTPQSGFVKLISEDVICTQALRINQLSSRVCIVYIHQTSISCMLTSN